MWQKEGLCDVALLDKVPVSSCVWISPSSNISLNFIPMTFISDWQSELILNAMETALTNLLTDIWPRLVLECTNK